MPITSVSSNNSIPQKSCLHDSDPNVLSEIKKVHNTPSPRMIVFPSDFPKKYSDPTTLSNTMSDKVKNWVNFSKKSEKEEIDLLWDTIESVFPKDREKKEYVLFLLEKITNPEYSLDEKIHHFMQIKQQAIEDHQDEFKIVESHEKIAFLIKKVRIYQEGNGNIKELKRLEEFLKKTENALDSDNFTKKDANKIKNDLDTVSKLLSSYTQKDHQKSRVLNNGGM